MVTPRTDPDAGKTRRAYDPHLDPALQFDPQRSRIEKLIDDALASGDAEQMKAALEELKRLQSPYLNWAGKVQMIYIDPPYGIKYGSHFQPFVNKRDVKDRKDEDLTQEPEMIKAFRATWELGIHSYRTYLRDRLIYDKSARTYVCGDRFDPLFLKPDAATCLSQLRSVATGIVSQEETWIGQLPAFDTVPSLVRGIDTHTLRRVIEAIRTTQALERRVSVPFQPCSALALDRAACDRVRRFRWHTHVTLEIGPHPGLSNAQKKVIALDYGMRGGKASISVRKALLYYTLKRLGLDTDPSTRNPADQQIVLLNREVLDGVA